MRRSMSGGSGRRFGRAGGEGAHGRITQHVSILDAGPLLFDADAVHDVAVASSNAISSDVQLRCRCFKSDTLKIPFKERRTLVKKKKERKRYFSNEESANGVAIYSEAAQSGIQSSRCGENASSTRYKRLDVAVYRGFFFFLIILRIKPLTKHSNWCTVHRVTYWLLYWPHRSATVRCDLYEEPFFF